MLSLQSINMTAKQYVDHAHFSTKFWHVKEFLWYWDALDPYCPTSSSYMCELFKYSNFEAHYLMLLNLLILVHNLNLFKGFLFYIKLFFVFIYNYKIKLLLRTNYLYFSVYIKMDYCLYQNSASNGLNQHHCSAAESGTFPFLSPKIFDQKNGSCPRSKKFFSTKMKVNVPKPVSLWI